MFIMASKNIQNAQFARKLGHQSFVLQKSAIKPIISHAHIDITKWLSYELRRLIVMHVVGKEGSRLVIFQSILQREDFRLLRIKFHITL